MKNKPFIFLALLAATLSCSKQAPSVVATIEIAPDTIFISKDNILLAHNYQTASIEVFNINHYED
jgi:hypothetical protein